MLYDRGDIFALYRAPIFVFLVNGEDQTLIHNFMYSWEVSSSLKKADQLRLECSLPDVRFLDSWEFQQGNSIVVRFGYADNLSRKYDFTVVYLEPSFNADGTIRITLTGWDLSYSLSKYISEVNWGQLSSTDIAVRYARQLGLKYVVDESDDLDPEHPFVHTSRDNAWKFLRQRAAEIGFECYIKNRILFFVDSDKLKKAEPARTYVYKEVNTILKTFKPTVKTGEIPNMAATGGTGKKAPGKQGQTETSGNGQESTKQVWMSWDAGAKDAISRDNMWDAGNSSFMGKVVTDKGKTPKDYVRDKLGRTKIKGPPISVREYSDAYQRSDTPSGKKFIEQQNAENARLSVGGHTYDGLRHLKAKKANTEKQAKDGTNKKVFNEVRIGTPEDSRNRMRLIARAKRKWALDKSREASAELVLEPVLDAGAVVRFEGLGLFSGNYYITELRHSGGGGGAANTNISKMSRVPKPKKHNKDKGKKKSDTDLVKNLKDKAKKGTDETTVVVHAGETSWTVTDKAGAEVYYQEQTLNRDAIAMKYFREGKLHQMPANPPAPVPLEQNGTFNRLHE